jgi:hypothetical protein
MNAKTLLRLSWKTSILFCASTVGIVAGTSIASPVLSMMNYLANEGPYFPAPSSPLDCWHRQQGVGPAVGVFLCVSPYSL